MILNENEFGTLTEMSENVGQPDTSEGVLENTDEEAKEYEMPTENDADTTPPT